jgi:lipoteichoic acid synthase
MPYMTALARRSLYFDRFYGQTAEGTTSDGEFTTLQSLYPLPAGSVQSSYPANNYRGIPRILSERGYATMSAHGYFGDLWNMRTVHPRLGFQKSFFREDYVQRETLGLGLADVEFFRQTAPRLERERRPFMAFLITLSTHHDWALPRKYKKLIVGNLERTLVGNYLQSMNHFDTGFGELLDSLKRDGLLDQSVLVIFGDHKGQFGKGEAEGRAALAELMTKHAGWARPDSGFDYRYWLAQNQIPLIIHLPNDEAAGTRSVTSGNLDIAPTVLNLLGIQDHDMVTLGRDLTQGKDEFVVFRNGSFVYGDTLCVTPNSSIRNAKCRDTRTGARLDPASLASRFDQARDRLSVSDAIIEGNLIPKR